ncbi:MAG: type 4a pilus biogenesis protein PilO [Thermodesulfobacteriota bacterium]
MKLPWEKLEKIKRPYKMGIFFGTNILLAVIFFFLLYQPVRDDVNKIHESIGSLGDKKLTAEKTVRNIPIIKKRLEELNIRFEAMSEFLPQKKEVGQLLQKVSGNGASAGLEISLFQPHLQEVFKDFYAEISFDLRVKGPYLNLASFFHLTSLMDRIVNIEDIKVGTPVSFDGEVILSASCQGRTFRFLTPEEIKKAEEAKKAAQKKAAPRPQTQ